MMKECKDRILKRINSQYKAVLITGLVILLVVLVIACTLGNLMAGLVVFTLLSVVTLIATLPMLIKYKKSMDVIASTEPVICTVTGSDRKYISSKRTYQVAYFTYEGEKCYAFDYDKQLDEIEVGQQLYVWKVDKKRYEIVHIE